MAQLKTKKELKIEIALSKEHERFIVDAIKKERTLRKKLETRIRAKKFALE